MPKDKKWGRFSRLFNRKSKGTSGEEFIIELEPDQESQSDSMDGFVIEESDARVLEVEEASSGTFVIEPSLKDYTILGLDGEVSIDELKSRYRLLIKQNHPDNGGDANEFMKIQKAYKKIRAYLE